MTTVVHVIGQLSRGGAERQLIYLAEALQSRGYPQVIVSFGDPAQDTLSDWVKSLGIPLRWVPPSGLKPYRLAQFGRTLLPYRNAVLQSWSMHTNFYAYLLPSFLYSQLIFSFRANPAIDYYSGKPIPIPQSYIYAKADCVLSNSQTAIDAAHEQGVSMRQTGVVSNIIRVHGRAHPGQTDGVVRIVAAGRLSPRKSYDVLVRALANVTVPYELLLAGTGDEQANLERLARDLKVNVNFLGEIEDVPALMSTCHIAVHPSVTEGSSNTILEAMAEGLPVVTTVESGSEWIEHGTNGLLAPAGQVDRFTEQIMALAQDSALRVRLGQAALAKIADQCSIEHVTSQYEAIYQRLGVPTPTPA